MHFEIERKVSFPEFETFTELIQALNWLCIS